MTGGFEWGIELPTLRARRLALRWLVPDDADDILAIFGDPEVVRFWSSPPIRDLAEARALIGQIHEYFESRHLFQWGAALNDTNRIVGTCTLLGVTSEHGRAEIGFALRRSCWGQGLATEVLETIIGFAFDVLGLHRLEADVDPENTRSLAVLERQGFTREGHLRERWNHQGQWRDTILLGLLEPEWRQSRAGFC